VLRSGVVEEEALGSSRKRRATDFCKTLRGQEAEATRPPHSTFFHKIGFLQECRNSFEYRDHSENSDKGTDRHTNKLTITDN